MGRLSGGDCVRTEIPDETDPDHDRHTEHGWIMDILEDEEGIRIESEFRHELVKNVLSSTETS